MLGLAAENGFFYRWPIGKREVDEKWEYLFEDAEENLWLESIRDVMNTFIAKTDGSYIEDRESMIIWNFKDADPEFGTWQSKDLRN